MRSKAARRQPAATVWQQDTKTAKSKAAVQQPDGQMAIAKLTGSQPTSCQQLASLVARQKATQQAAGRLSNQLPNSVAERKWKCISVGKHLAAAPFGSKQIAANFSTARRQASSEMVEQSAAIQHGNGKAARKWRWTIMVEVMEMDDHGGSTRTCTTN